MNQVELKIEGMTCDHCVRGVTRALQEVPGVTVRRVEIGAAEVTYQDALAAEDDLVAAVEDEGYSVVGVTRPA